jgi:hypothetical protein
LIEKYKALMSSRGVPIDKGSRTDFGLSKNDALHALEILEASNIAILGGDVFIVVGDKAKPAYANWSFERVQDAEAGSFVSNSHMKAREYIKNYPQSGPLALFLLVTDSDL